LTNLLRSDKADALMGVASRDEVALSTSKALLLALVGTAVTFGS